MYCYFEPGNQTFFALLFLFLTMTSEKKFPAREVKFFLLCCCCCTYEAATTTQQQLDLTSVVRYGTFIAAVTF